MLKQQDFTDMSVADVYKEKMSYEEALEELKHQLNMLPNEPPNDFVGNDMAWLKERKKNIDARKIGIEAIEKQIPKKPHMDNENGIYEQECCPTCNRHLFPNEHHCRCGQHLDWSDVE